MPVERLLSLRQPRIAIFFAASLVLALAAGVGLEIVVREMLKGLTDLAAGSPDAVVLRSAAFLTGLAIFFCVFTLLVSGALFHAFTRAIEERQLPPSGVWSIGAVRRSTGPEAVRMAKLGRMLVIALGACGLAFGLTALWLVSRVVACAGRHV